MVDVDIYKVIYSIAPVAIFFKSEKDISSLTKETNSRLHILEIV